MSIADFFRANYGTIIGCFSVIFVIFVIMSAIKYAIATSDADSEDKAEITRIINVIFWGISIIVVSGMTLLTFNTATNQAVNVIDRNQENRKPANEDADAFHQRVLDREAKRKNP